MRDEQMKPGLSVDELVGRDIADYLVSEEVTEFVYKFRTDIDEFSTLNANTRE